MPLAVVIGLSGLLVVPTVQGAKASELVQRLTWALGVTRSPSLAERRELQVNETLGVIFLWRCVVADHPAHAPEVSPPLRAAGQLRLEGDCKRCRTMLALYDDSSRARDEIDGHTAKQ